MPRRESFAELDRISHGASKRALKSYVSRHAKNACHREEVSVHCTQTREVTLMSHDDSQPLFRSAEDAARWALSDGLAAITRNSLWGYIDSGPEAPSRGLGGFDGAGQAGIIRAYIRELRDPLSEILIAQAASVKLPCGCGRDCCSGWQTNGRWSDSIEQVASWWEMVHGGDDFDRPRLLRGCLRRFFGEKISIDVLAKRSGLHRVTVSEFNGRVLRPLKPLKDQAWCELEDKLAAVGLIEGSQTPAVAA